MDKLVFFLILLVSGSVHEVFAHGVRNDCRFSDEIDRDLYCPLVRQAFDEVCEWIDGIEEVVCSHACQTGQDQSLHCQIARRHDPAALCQASHQVTHRACQFTPGNVRHLMLGDLCRFVTLYAAGARRPQDVSDDACSHLGTVIRAACPQLEFHWYNHVCQHRQRILTCRWFDTWGVLRKIDLLDDRADDENDIEQLRRPMIHGVPTDGRDVLELTYAFVDTTLEDWVEQHADILTLGFLKGAGEEGNIYLDVGTPDIADALELQGDIRDSAHRLFDFQRVHRVVLKGPFHPPEKEQCEWRNSNHSGHQRVYYHNQILWDWNSWTIQDQELDKVIILAWESDEGMMDDRFGAAEVPRWQDEEHILEDISPRDGWAVSSILNMANGFQLGTITRKDIWGTEKEEVIDTDNDGLPDDLERQIGTDPNNPDTDGDGIQDHREFLQGYDPTHYNKPITALIFLLLEEDRQSPADYQRVARRRVRVKRENPLPEQREAQNNPGGNQDNFFNQQGPTPIIPIVTLL